MKKIILFCLLVYTISCKIPVEYTQNHISLGIDYEGLYIGADTITVRNWIKNIDFLPSKSSFFSLDTNIISKDSCVIRTFIPEKNMYKRQVTYDNTIYYDTLPYSFGDNLPLFPRAKHFKDDKTGRRIAVHYRSKNGYDEWVMEKERKSISSSLVAYSNERINLYNGMYLYILRSVPSTFCLGFGCTRSNFDILTIHKDSTEVTVLQTVGYGADFLPLYKFFYSRGRYYALFSTSSETERKLNFINLYVLSDKLKWQDTHIRIKMK